jgi:hypothetical protein
MQIIPAKRFVSVALPVLIALAHAPTASAQVRPTIRDTSTTRISMPAAAPGMAGMAGMMSGPHHALAMAYGENLATFARAVNIDARRANMVNLDLARPATSEMRRSFDQMKVHHQAQMSTVGTTMRMPMMHDSAAAMTRPARRDSMMAKPMPAPMRTDSNRAAKMGDMQAHMATIETHLGMLETEVKATTPSAAKVIEHTAEILKVRDAAMRATSDSGGRMGRPDSR